MQRALTAIVLTCSLHSNRLLLLGLLPFNPASPEAPLNRDRQGVQHGPGGPPKVIKTRFRSYFGMNGLGRVFNGALSLTRLLHCEYMTSEELEREYVTLRQQADAVRSYL